MKIVLYIAGGLLVTGFGLVVAFLHVVGKIDALEDDELRRE